MPNDPQKNRRSSDSPTSEALEILRHVDDKLLEHQRVTTEWITEWIKTHEEAQAIRYDAIREEITQGQQASERRHTALLETIQGYMQAMNDKQHETPCPHLVQSIPNEDWPGHNNYHVDIMNWDAKVTDFKWYVAKALAVAMLIGFGGWLLLAVKHEFIANLLKAMAS